MKAQPRGAQTVIRALDILGLFRERESALSLSEISRRVHLTLPTTHRLLRALASKDFVVFDSDGRTYSLGPEILRLAGAIMRRDDLVHVTMPSLERLLDRAHETVGLHRPVGTVRVCIAELEAPQVIRMASGVGQSYPIYAGAAGKVLLAWGDSWRTRAAASHIRRVASRAPVRNVDLLAELARVRRQGYAMSFGETVEGASAVAAPILDSNGIAIAALNVTGPHARFTKVRMTRIVEPLLTESRLVARRLGYAHRPGGSDGADRGVKNGD